MTDLLLTQEQVRVLLRRVGFKPRPAKIGSAIAMCEAPAFDADGTACSDFGAIGDQDLANETWGYSYGGFQIRSLRDQKGTGGWRDETRLLVPEFNARAAASIRQSAGGWSPWSTYTSGMYRAYLQDMYPPPPGTYIVVAGDTLSGIAEKLGSFTWEELATVNDIHAPYSIFIGQSLTLPT